MLGSECNLKMYGRNLGYTLLLQTDDPKQSFSTISQLIGNSNSLFGMKHNIHNRIIGQVRWKIKWVSYTFSKCHELWSTNGKNWPTFLPTLRKFCVYFVARLRRGRSPNETQPSFAKRWTANRANNLP